MVSFSHSNGRTVGVDGAEIYFEITGNERGRPLVLLHGGMGNIEDFNQFVATGFDGFRLIGIDSRGHGASWSRSARRIPGRRTRCPSWSA